MFRDELLWLMEQILLIHSLLFNVNIFITFYTLMVSY